MSSVPQTVGFELVVRFDQMERPSDKPSEMSFVFHSFEKMLSRFSKEKNRRAIADRASSGKYRMFLTEHGKAVVASDAAAASRHSDVGQWFSM